MTFALRAETNRENKSRSETKIENGQLQWLYGILFSTASYSINFFSSCAFITKPSCIYPSSVAISLFISAERNLNLKSDYL